MHQLAYNQMCISYFVCCSAQCPCPNWCLAAAVIHTVQSMWLSQHSQVIQISFFLSLSPLINNACPAEKRLGTKAHSRPQAAPQAPSLRFPPAAEAGGRALTAAGRAPQRAEPRGRGCPGSRSPPHSVFLPVLLPLTLSCGAVRARRKRALLQPAGDRRGGAERSEQWGGAPFPPFPGAQHSQSTPEVAADRPIGARAVPKIPPSGRGCLLRGRLPARPWGAAGWACNLKRNLKLFAKPYQLMVTCV